MIYFLLIFIYFNTFNLIIKRKLFRLHQVLSLSDSTFLKTRPNSVSISFKIVNVILIYNNINEKFIS
jgi:hypothetical protein